MNNLQNIKKYQYEVFYINGARGEIISENKQSAKAEAKRHENAGISPKVINVRKKY
jgi:hypothetical protein